MLFPSLFRAKRYHLRQQKKFNTDRYSIITTELDAARQFFHNDRYRIGG